jgi:hypothetical protein
MRDSHQFYNTKVRQNPPKNAHLIWVVPVGPLACLPVKNKIGLYSDFNGLNGPNRSTPYHRSFKAFNWSISIPCPVPGSTSQ